MCGGRLQRRGKSNHSEAPADGHRSDSPGIFYKFPVQRSSGSVRVALRLSRPTGLRNGKIFSHLCRCPPHTHTTGALPFSVLFCGRWCGLGRVVCGGMRYCIRSRPLQSVKVKRINIKYWYNLKKQLTFLTDCGIVKNALLWQDMPKSF